MVSTRKKMKCYVGSFVGHGAPCYNDAIGGTVPVAPSSKRSSPYLRYYMPGGAKKESCEEMNKTVAPSTHLHRCEEHSDCPL
jgi:hypothetical protein